MTVCGKCGGTGKIEKPIGLNELGEVDCDLCGGTGLMPVDYESAVLERLDRIIQLLEAKQ